ncbi:hypothetical protein FGO68_gene16158 [Halteria grandinella]|uniref:Uncharacterized protein n=1 Tax=Halteria grandinella TaxID=5974 RepID=A0A8J8SV42_HALGN|nr:hypothetical protein FGO68_gene16158 [Halteria grandinella]
MIRWLLTSIILVVLRDHSTTQIFLLLIISVLSQCYLIYVRPLDTRLENTISLFNELMVSLYLYVLISLTDYNDSLRDQAGAALLYIVLISFLANFLKLLIQTTLLFKSRLLPLLKRHLQFLIKKRQKQRVVTLKPISLDFSQSSKSILQFIPNQTVDVKPATAVMVISENEGMDYTTDMHLKVTVIGKKEEGKDMKLEEIDDDTRQNIEQPNHFT